MALRPRRLSAADGLLALFRPQLGRQGRRHLRPGSRPLALLRRALRRHAPERLRHLCAAAQAARGARSGPFRHRHGPNPVRLPHHRQRQGHRRAGQARGHEGRGARLLLQHAGRAARRGARRRHRDAGLQPSDAAWRRLRGADRGPQEHAGSRQAFDRNAFAHRRGRTALHGLLPHRLHARDARGLRECVVRRTGRALRRPHVPLRAAGVGNRSAHRTGLGVASRLCRHGVCCCRRRAGS